MKITIAQPLRPFSHQSGSSCIIPYSRWKITAFPSLIRLEHMTEADTLDIHLSLQGPVKDFTVQQDLEKGAVLIFGVALQGYFRFVLRQKDRGLCLDIEKTPPVGIDLLIGNQPCHIEGAKELILSTKQETTSFRIQEKLSLGVHKCQDFALIRKRAQMAEIFPHWLRLAQMTPHTPASAASCGIIDLLERCANVVSEADRIAVIPSFLPVFLAGFSSILAPRLQDDEFQGIMAVTSYPAGSSSLDVISKGAKIIRSLFFKEEGARYHILPCLPPEFHCGRFIGIETVCGDRLDIAWSKKQIHTMIIYPLETKEMHLSLQKDIRSFRLRTCLSDKGVVLDALAPVLCKQGQTVYLDRFQRS